jgi:hypothetical protein
VVGPGSLPGGEPHHGGPLSIPHTAVHHVARRFLEPAQDLLVLGIALALLGLMVRALGRLFGEIVEPALDFAW